MPPLFLRLVAIALCTSIAGVSPARADDTGARMMMGLFGAMLNDAQQQKQRPQQSDMQSPPQQSDVEWDNPKSNKKVVSSIERTKTKKIQAALKTLGYYKSSIDGLPGPTTASAIKAWQTQVGEEPDGVVTSDQMEMLSLAATVKQESRDGAASPAEQGEAEQRNAAEKADIARLEKQRKADAEHQAQAEQEAEALKKSEAKKAAEQSVSSLPTCTSEAAVDALKDVLGDRLIDWDPNSFCENRIGTGARECVGHVTLTEGEVRIYFSFKQAKSDPNKFLTQVEEIPSDYDIAHRYSNNDPRGLTAVLKSMSACDRGEKK